MTTRSPPRARAPRPPRRSRRAGARRRRADRDRLVDVRAGLSERRKTSTTSTGPRCRSSRGSARRGARPRRVDGMTRKPSRSSARSGASRATGRRAPTTAQAGPVSSARRRPCTACPPRAAGAGSAASRALGRVKMRSGSPRSTISPSCRKQTSSATSRAKPISCVAISIVMPSALSSRIASSTSPTSSGSSALVTSSSSSARGRVASARAIATRCCWPPESRSGCSSSRPASPKRASSSRARASASARAHAVRAHGGERDVLEHAQVREEVEGLEDHAEPAAHGDRVDRRVGDDLAVEQHVAVVDLLEQVDAAQQRRLARARRADQRDGGVLVRPRGRSRAAPARRRRPS